MDRFWPALRLNAMEQGHVYGVPFQNSTPLLYYSVDAFRQAGLDPDRPPATWQEWVAMHCVSSRSATVAARPVGA
jgi:sn-glycerol 3-phosphate transport system substrate-binding protein